MGKQVFLELTTEENLKKINIDPILVDSFKRVMAKVQEYFDSHGYSDKIDFETIVNEYILPKETVDRETVRHSDEFIKALNEYRKSIKELETIVSVSFGDIDEDKFLNEYIKKHYKVGLFIEVYTEKTTIEALGEYYNDINTIVIKKDSKELSIEKLDSILCHEFIHCLTMCGKDKLGAISDEMQVSMYEPLTEMLSTEILNGDFPVAYFNCCMVMEYINRLTAVNDYFSFLSRKLDERYTPFSRVLESMQDAFDRSRFMGGKFHGDILDEDKKELFADATETLIDKDYKDVNDLLDNLMNVYYMRGVFSQEQIEGMQEIIAGHYLSTNNISNDQVKNRIMQLLKVKNQNRLIGDKEYFPITIDDQEYLIDSEGNVYYFDNTIINKIPNGPVPHAVFAGVLDIFNEAGWQSYDLSTIDFGALGNNLASQQEMLEKELNTLMGGESLNRPYIKPSTVSTVVARDTGERAEVMEPIQSKPKLRRPHIKKETMSMLQGKIELFELDTKKKQILAQKEIVQNMMTNQQEVVSIDIEDEEVDDMGMSM